MNTLKLCIIATFLSNGLIFATPTSMDLVGPHGASSSCLKDAFSTELITYSQMFPGTLYVASSYNQMFLGTLYVASSPTNRVAAIIGHMNGSNHQQPSAPTLITAQTAAQSNQAASCSSSTIVAIKAVAITSRKSRSNSVTSLLEPLSLDHQIRTITSRPPMRRAQSALTLPVQD